MIIHNTKAKGHYAQLPCCYFPRYSSLVPVSQFRVSAMLILAIVGDKNVVYGADVSSNTMENGENYIMKNYMICVAQRILFRCLNREK